MPRLFGFGYGRTAEALGQKLAAQGWSSAGTCRTADKQRDLTGKGIGAYVMNDTETPAASCLDAATHLLISTPPGPAGDPVLAAMRDALVSHAPSLHWIGYLSTTGVYGDRQGDWVDETSELTPTSERGERRCRAEQAWFRLGKEINVPVQSFRLAGIYGPGSNQIVSLRQGKAKRINKPGHVFSRIHVTDIVRVLEASIANPNPGAAYNVCDDEAAPPQDVVAYAAEIAGLTPPPEIPFDDAELSPMGRSFYGETKRVSNRRIREELGVKLLYPTYREGLQACLAAGD